MAAQLELEQKPFIELQINALAEENRIKPKRVEKFVDELRERLLATKDLNLDKLLNKALRLPIIGRPNSLQDDDHPKNFKFIPPESTHLIGGLTTLTALQRIKYVDLAVVIPSKCFDKKDVKNQRYHHKRVLYLAQIAHLLNGSTGFGLVGKIEYKYHQGDFLKPVVLITPKSPKLNDIAVQLFACPDPQDFPIKLSLLTPSHGNVSPKWFFKDYNFNSDSLDDNLKEFLQNDSDITASPFYNSGILFDIEAVSNSGIISEHIGVGTSISEALLLVKIWLYQREIHQHFSFVLSMLVAQMQSKQLIHPNMSSYQIFKTVIKSVIDSDWSTNGFAYFEDHQSKLAAFKSVFPVVFLGPSGNLNLCYNVTIDLYNRLKHEAHNTQSILASNSPDTFELLFLKKFDFVNKFDAFVHLPKCTKKLPEKLECIKKFMDHGVFVPRVYSDSILDLVQRALTDRVVLVQQSPEHLLLDKRWNLKGIPYDPTNEEHTFTLGLMLDAEKSLRIIDVGPEAQKPEAEEFRKFWEPKCQLRLQNGIISETVVWHVESFSQRRSIIKYILNHALRRLNITNVVVHYTLLERFISLPNVYFKWRDDVADDGESAGSSDQIAQTSGQSQKRKHDDNANDAPRTRGRPVGVGEETFQKVLHAYNELNKVLRSLEKLPHSITSIHPMSSHLRACSIFPPLPAALQSRDKSLKRRKGATLLPQELDHVGKILVLEPVEILISLESTGKWPDDLEALEAAKLDCLIQLGEQLKHREFSVKFAKSGYIDVLNGQFVFRIRVKCAKELSMAGSARGKQDFERRRFDLEILPRVHAALDQLYREHPAFSLTCRLVKRWIGSNLMTDHISGMTLELIVASLFLHPQPFNAPASSMCGLRRFLRLFAEHNWREQPLIVNFDNLLKIDEINQIKAAVQKSRDKWPPLVICTSFEKQYSKWSRVEPSEKGLELLTKMCTKALEFVDQEILPKFDVQEECKALFRPNFKLFDLLIKLSPQQNQTFFMSIDPPRNFKLVGKESQHRRPSAFQAVPIVDLSFIEGTVDILRKDYGHLAWFFYDKYGQRVIGAIMKPDSEKNLDGKMGEFMYNIKRCVAPLVDSVSLVKHES